MPSIVKQDTLRTLADQLASVQNQMRPLAEQEAAIKAELRDLLATTGPGDYQAGEHVITATATRRLNTDKLAENYPPGQYPHLYELKLSTTAVRKHLSPVEVDQFMGDAGAMGIRIQ